MASRFWLAALLLLTSCASGPARQPGDWTVTRSSDPITGMQRCVVAAVDRLGDDRYSRFASLYPFVENNSSLGLLVGISSGGQVRTPTGDILWRVDSNTFRELKMMDTPALTGSQASPPQPQSSQGNPDADKALRDALAMTARLTSATLSGVTAVSGDKAKELLAEMTAGQSLIFRGATAAPSMGLPSNATNQVGLMTTEGLRPILLDASFRAGLAECGIS